MTARVSLSDPQTALTDRALDFLAAGPADAQSLISHVCQLPGAPKHVAEHMAAALFAGHQRFLRDGEGRWRLREGSAATYSFVPIASAAAATTADARATERVAADELSTTEFVVVDVETTGTRAGTGDRVTEVAAVLVRGTGISMAFETLVNPERPIPPAIVALTNITWEMVREAPRFTDVCAQLLGALEGRVFVAHNAAFDWRFVGAEVSRATGRRLTGRTLCTVRLARRLLPQLRRRNLDSLAVYFGFDNEARHRAGGDAIVTARILIKLLELARDRGCRTLDDLDAVLSPGSSVARKRRGRYWTSGLPRSTGDDSTA